MSLYYDSVFIPLKKKINKLHWVMRSTYKTLSSENSLNLTACLSDDDNNITFS